jgi:hypothetical protein
MKRDQLIARAKEILAEAYQEAAEMIVLYLEKHPSEKLQPLCKEIDQDNWRALEARVIRLRKKPSNDAGSEITRASDSSFRHAKSAITKADDEQLAEIEKTIEERKLHSVTEKDRRETDAAMAPMNRAVNSFASLGTAQHIEQAIEEINEAVAGDGLSPEALWELLQLSKSLVDTIEFAMKMAGVPL